MAADSTWKWAPSGRSTTWARETARWSANGSPKRIKRRLHFANVQDQVAQEVVQAHAQLEATATQVDDAMTAVKEAIITYNGTLRGIGETRGAGDLLQLVNRPQEAVAALQQLNRAYDIYFAAINGYNRAQFQLYRALGFPARILVCDHPVGEVQPLDTSRPPEHGPRLPARSFAAMSVAACGRRHGRLGVHFCLGGKTRRRIAQTTSAGISSNSRRGQRTTTISTTGSEATTSRAAVERRRRRARRPPVPLPSG